MNNYFCSSKITEMQKTVTHVNFTAMRPVVRKAWRRENVGPLAFGIAEPPGIGIQEP